MKRLVSLLFLAAALVTLACEGETSPGSGIEPPKTAFQDTSAPFFFPTSPPTSGPAVSVSPVVATPPASPKPTRPSASATTAVPPRQTGDPMPEDVAPTSTLLVPPVSSQAQREALVALYNATDGPNWENNENWLSAADVGDWYGVTADSKGIVTGLGLSKNNLKGELPPDLGDLSGLEAIDFRGNRLKGAIPPDLARLANLKVLQLGSNTLRGAIPAELGKLTRLTDLDLGGNLLSEPIPPELGELSNLTRLSLAGNELTGEIPPELGNLTALTRLHLGGNWLRGGIPPELGNLINLEILATVNMQSLGGEIPPELGNLSNLEYLQMSFNRLNGKIPPELGNLTKLKKLSLRKNNLSGPIPPELGNLTSLEELNLYVNELSGHIPRELGNLTRLKLLDLGHNQLRGPIPRELGNLTNLEELLIILNKLSGEIPLELGNLVNLQRLDIMGNRLIGEIPPELGNLGKVVELNIVTNRLSGTIPAELGNLARVETLKLDGNQLTGEIPPELGNLQRLLELGLSRNELSGCIPTTLRIQYYLAEALELQFCDRPPVPVADARQQQVADFIGPNTVDIDPAVVALLYADAAGETRTATARLALVISSDPEISVDPPLEAYVKASGGEPYDEYTWLVPFELARAVICRPEVFYISLSEPGEGSSWELPPRETDESLYSNLNGALPDVVAAHQAGMPENQAALYALFVRGNSVVVQIQTREVETRDGITDWLAQRDIYLHPNASSSGEVHHLGVLLPISQILPLAQQFPDAYLDAADKTGEGLPMLRSQWPPETIHFERSVTQQYIEPGTEQSETGKGILPCPSSPIGG